MAEEENKPAEEAPAEEKPAEEKPAEEKNKEEGEKSPDSGSQTMIDAAEDAAARLERANAKKEKLLDREEAMRVKKALGGKADAGSPKVDSDEDYAKKVMAGDMNGKES